ncbi:MAG: 23S rRNA (uracil(1939)-C(5))-methyltransferase RlmD [Candidatus Omnitrophota bacterium]
MRVKVEKIVFGGQSLCRSEGKVILTDEGLPQETIDVEVVKEKKNYVEAHTLNIVEASSQRVKARCDHYQLCSAYQYIDYPVQVETKKQQLQEMLSHRLKNNLPPILFRPAQNLWHYRNKVRFPILWEDSQAYLAYHLPGSWEKLQKISDCFLIAEPMLSFLRELPREITALKLDFIREVSLRQNDNGSGMLLLLDGVNYRDALKRLGGLETLKERYPLAGIVYKDIQTGARKNLIGEGVLIEEILGRSFLVGCESFFQINIAMLKLLINDLRATLKLEGKKNIADLYCGVGTLGILLSDSGCHCHFVEESKENLPFLKQNIQRNGLTQATVYEEACERWIPRLHSLALDLVILDPPRKGLNTRIIAALLQTPCKSIAYISCNPATLARDLELLGGHYRVSHLFGYDFFAQTPHIEVLAILEQK